MTKDIVQHDEQHEQSEQSEQSEQTEQTEQHKQSEQSNQSEQSESAEKIISQKWFRAYWALFLILCILMIESLFKGGIALGTVIWFAFAESVSILFAKYCTGKLNRKALLLTIPIALINISHLLFSNAAFQSITWASALVLFAVQLTYLSKPEKSCLFDWKNIIDVLHTIFVNAFVFMPYPFKGLIKFSKEKSRRTTVHVLVGILVSLPIAIIFIFLFSSADDSFAALIHNFAVCLYSNLRIFIADLVIGTIMCAFVSAAFVGANARKPAHPAPRKALVEINNVTLGTALLIITVIIALYVGVQFNHWFGKAPVNYIQMDEYSTIARTGFFELVWASCFLLVLVAVAAALSTKRKGQLTLTLPIKIPLLILCACNLIVLYSAIEKMISYIGRSGITSYRALVLWFIAVIVALMVCVIIKIARFTFRAFQFSCIAVIMLVCVLSYCDIDYHVAKNHIYLAENHLIQNLEADMLSRLSYSAVKPIMEYKGRIEGGNSVNDTTRMQSQTEVLSILNRELMRQKSAANRSASRNPVMGFNFSRQHTENALRTTYIND